MTRYLITIDGAPTAYVEAASIWDALVDIFPPGDVIGLFATVRTNALTASVSTVSGSVVRVRVTAEQSAHAINVNQLTEVLAWTN